MSENEVNGAVFSAVEHVWATELNEPHCSFQIATCCPKSMPLPMPLETHWTPDTRLWPRGCHENAEKNI